jgi:hypothetical protein
MMEGSGTAAGKGQGIIEISEESIQRVREDLLRSELPLVREVMRDIESTLLGGKGTGQWSHAAGGVASPYNRIPGIPGAPCRPVLLVYCTGWREFSRRLDDIYEHMERKCPDTEHIYFVTDSWVPSVWQRHERYLLQLKRANLTVLFSGMGNLVRLNP